MSKPTYWQGIEELEATSDFQEKVQHEFPEKLPVLEMVNEGAESNTTSRRDFLKYMGFSVAAATVAASCEMPVRKAIPYVVKPEEMTPGIANYYASTFADGSDYCSILVKVRDGRPIKIEGNELSTVSRGGTSARVQGSVLSLYDTNRIKGPKAAGKASTWETNDKAIKAALDKASREGKTIALLSSSIMSPATKQIIKDFKSAYPTTKLVEYDAISYSGVLDAAQEMFGKRAIPSMHFDKANVMVSFGADFLGTWLSPTEFTAQYAQTRKIKRNDEHPHLSRHFQFEAVMSQSGANADIRTPLKPTNVIAALLNLHNIIAKKMGGNTISGVSSLSDEKAMKNLNTAANELMANKGKSIVVCGSNDKNVQIVAFGINQMLGNIGATIDTNKPYHIKQGNDRALMELVGEMNSGKVGVAMVHNCNPAYDMVMADKFKTAFTKVPTKVSINVAHNETELHVDYTCPDSHYLESWNDAEVKTGSYSICQPTIRPIFNTRQFQESLMAWMSTSGMSVAPMAADSTVSPFGNTGVNRDIEPATAWYGYLTSFWQNNVFSLQSKFLSFQSFWDKAVHDGVVEVGASSTMADAVESLVAGADVSSAGRKAASQYKNDGTNELVIYEKSGIGNGQYVDNPWLQELPDPISKVTWDNYVMVSFSDAKANGWEDGKVVKVAANGYSVELPVIIQPGLAKGTYAAAMGYGRTVCGPTGLLGDIDEATGMGEAVGANVFPFGTVNEHAIQYSVAGATLADAGRSMDIARTQTHHVINTDEYDLRQRTVIREGIVGTIPDVKKQIKQMRGEFKHLNDQTMYSGHNEELAKGHHWKMSIDLNSCLGCGACAVACMAENNVSVVGKTEVTRAHEMHWLRMDRYYTGEDMDNPDVVFQPMMCQHCDNAPCENVCPVSATNHSSEGLNQMAYNRCIGTRYCANNCPYKVRRFNWYDYMKADSFPWNEHDPKSGQLINWGQNDMLFNDLSRMVLNPDVVVRSRGVMEKCSFCVQRLQEGKLAAKKEGRALKDGDIKTACQQACATGAITFGDYNDTHSEVRKDLDEDGRTFFVIEEVNTAPSVGYKAKIRNRSKEEDLERRGLESTIYAKKEDPNHGHHDAHGGGHDDHHSEGDHH